MSKDKIVFSPSDGEFYKENGAIRFHIKQTYGERVDGGSSGGRFYDKAAFYYACDENVLTRSMTRRTAVSYPSWTVSLKTVLDPILPFPNEPVDEWIEIPFVEDSNGIKLDYSGVAQPRTINVPIATSINDLVVQYPANDVDPPVITGFNPSDSIDIAVGYYGLSGVRPNGEIVTIIYNQADFYKNTNWSGGVYTHRELRVVPPQIPSSGNTKFFTGIQFNKQNGVWSATFVAPGLRTWNYTGRNYTV